MSKIEYLGRNFVILLSLHNSYTCKSLKVDSSSRHLLLLIYLFICLSVAVLGLCCCMPVFFIGGERGSLSSCGAQVSHCSLLDTIFFLSRYHRCCTWVFLAAVHGAYSSFWHLGFFCWWLLLLQSLGS